MKKIINIGKAALAFGWTTVNFILTVILLLTGNHKYPMWIARMGWARPLFWMLGCSFTIKGEENVVHDNPSIYVGNHASNLDIPAMMGALPVNVYFLAKAELKKVPVIGWFVVTMGMIFIDRSNKEKAAASLKKAIEAIKKGKNIISFPEGTRSKTGEIGIFRRGSFNMAIEGGIDIVPVAIKGTDKALPAKTMNFQPTDVTVIIGKPISPKNYTIDQVDQYAADVREEVLRLLKSA